LELAKKEREFLHLKIETENKNVQTLSHELLVKQDFSANLIEKLYQLENISKHELKSVELFIQNELDIKSTRAMLQNQMGDLSSNFYSELKIKHPNLSNRDLKLAAMVVMQMSNKEIAISNNMTSETVRNAKYRLKKKMNLANNEDLSETLNSYLS
jgi:DNA-binding CsgD family transcriptional regulator